MKCFLLTTSAPAPEFLDALRSSSGVIYALHEGISLLPDLRFPEVRRFGCAYAAQRRNLPMDREIIYGGLGILADLLRQAEIIYPSPGVFRPGPLGFRITSNPRDSDRPAEAFRVAAGLQSLGVPIQISLSDLAKDCIHSPAHEFVDGALLAASKDLLKSEIGFCEDEKFKNGAILDW